LLLALWLAFGLPSEHLDEELNLQCSGIVMSKPVEQQYAH
jgi:hypothetical protein